jgi:hypothetical protein
VDSVALALGKLVVPAYGTQQQTIYPDCRRHQGEVTVITVATQRIHPVADMLSNFI